MDSEETCTMAESNVDEGKSLKELDKTPSSIEDIPEDPPTDNSLLDIQMPETPDSTKGQTSDGDLSMRLESPKTIKPVLGKLQAKKRLMAFANKFNVMKKVQTPNKLELSALSKGNNSAQNIKFNKDPEKKLKKKTEEKILAIEEIVREESKSKMLLAAKFTANSDGTIAGRSGKYVNRFKDRRRYKDRNISYKGPTRSPDRRRRRSEEKNEHKGSNDSGRIKDESRSTQDQKHSKEKKHDRNKRDENKFRDKKDDVKEKREEKKEEKKENVSDRDESKDKKDETKDKLKDRNKDKEKEFVKCSNWTELKKSGCTFDDYIEFKKRGDNSEKISKNRTPQDYTRCLEQMLMLNESRIKRSPVIVEGLDGPKEYHPESIKSTKRARGPCLLYSENPRVSLLLNLQQLSQLVTSERREKILDVAEGSKAIQRDENEYCESVRNWYRKLSQTPSSENSLETVCLTDVKFPKSKWDSDNEDTPEVPLLQKTAGNKNTSQDEQITMSSAHSSNSVTEEEPIIKSPINSDEADELDSTSISKSLVHEDIKCPMNSSSLLRSTSNEKLASEYEEFMKIVTSEIPLPGEDEDEEDEDEDEDEGEDEDEDEDDDEDEDENEGEEEEEEEGEGEGEEVAETNNLLSVRETPFENEELSSAKSLHHPPLTISSLQFDKTSKSSSPNYPQFDLECNILNRNTDPYFHLACTLKEINPIGVDNSLNHKKLSEQENNSDDNNEVDIERRRSNLTPEERSRSIPSDWENVRIKVERISDEESNPPSVKKKRKRQTSSSSSSSSSTSSETNRIKIKRKRKRKSKDSSSDDSDSSDSSSSSTTDSSSSDDRKKKKKRKKKKRKRKAEKRRKRKAKKVAKSKKKRRRKVSTDSSSSDSDFKETKRKKKSTKKKSLEKELIRSKKIQETLTEEDMLIEPHNIKEEIDSESTKEQPLEKSNVPENNHKQSLTVNITDDSVSKKQIRSHEIDGKTHHEDWEIDSLIVVGKEKLSKIETTNIKNNVRSISGAAKEMIENISTVPEIQDARVEEELTKSQNNVGLKKVQTIDEEDRSNAEFLVDWEAKSQLINKTIQDNSSFKKQNKSNVNSKKTAWEENDFDTLNVPSLLQLEKEVSKKQILADDWEVDSLEAIPDLLVDKKKSRNQKTLEREIKYDKQNDRYVEITKESSKETKKKQKRVRSIRIWEDEQEEGEREEMLLKEKKEKYKNSNWNVNSNTLLCRASKINMVPSVDRNKTKDWLGSCESNKKEWFDGPNNALVDPNNWLQLGKDEIIKIHKNDDEISKHSEEWLQESHEALKEGEQSTKCESNKNMLKKWDQNECSLIQKTKKSRWDRSSQDGDKTDDKTDVAWEEECNEWAKLVETKQKVEKIVTKPELNLLTKELQKEESTKNKYNKDNDFSIDQMIEENILNTDNLLHSANILKKSTKNRDSPGKSWMIDQMSMDLGIDKNIDTDFQNDSEFDKTDDILSNKGIRNKNIEMIRKANIELYSPSSPASSQKSENSDTSDSSSSSSSSKEDESSISTSKSFDSIKEDNHSIPLELDFDIPKLSKDITNVESFNDELELQSHMDIFAEFEIPELRIKKPIKVVPIAKPKEKVPTPPIVPKETPAVSKQEEVVEEKPALKLIPNQLLIRRPEPVKLKRNFDYLSDLNIQSKKKNEKIVRTIHEFTDNIKMNVEGQTKGIMIPFGEHLDSANENYKLKNDDTNFKTSENGESLIKNDKKRSPLRTEEKQYSNDRGKERKDDDRDRFDRRDYDSFKEHDDDRRRSSPVHSRGRRRTGGSPISSWERERSGSHSRSWSRSHSRSPRRRDDKGRRRLKEHRGKDEKKGRYGRSPVRFDSKDSRNDFTMTQDDRDDWLKRKYDNLERDRDKNTRSYDPIEMLRQRHAKTSRRDAKLRTDQEKQGFWPYEAESVLRDENESIDSYNMSQEFESENNHKSYYRVSSLEREMQSNTRSKRETNDFKRERLWNKDRDSVERFVSRKSDIGSAGASSRSSRSSPQRSKRSPIRYRRSTRSRSRSWSRSRTRSRTTSRSRSRSRGRSRSRSSSRSRFRSPDRHSRVFNRLSSRTPSPSRNRRRDRRMSRNDDDRKRSNTCFEKGRRIETIVQSIPTVTRVTADSTVLDHPEMQMNGNLDDNFQFSGESDSRNQYYYSGSNLTYPPCIDDSTTSSPKRLSLDDRLELELGIKKAVPTREYPPNFIPNSTSQQSVYRQPSTVVQIGNVLQVVPTEFGESPSISKNETISSSGCNTGNAVRGSSQVVRVGNVLQVVPTASLDWNATSTVPGLSTPNLDPSPNKIAYSSPSVSVSAPPRPSPLPVPVQNTAAPVVSVPITSLSPHSIAIPLPLSIPLSLPPAGSMNFPRVEPPRVVVQPVYNYEVILETRRKEREERKRLKDLKKKEKERKRIEKINRRALRLLEKKSKKDDNRKKGSPTLDRSVISALQEDVPAMLCVEAPSFIDEEKNDDLSKRDLTLSEIGKEVEEDEEEEEDDPEIEDDDDEDDDMEEGDLVEDEDEERKIIKTDPNSMVNIDELEIPPREWPSLPPPPLKGILVLPDFRRDYIPNGDIDDPSLEGILKSKIKDDLLEKDDDTFMCQDETNKLKKKSSRKKKSVQFADGIRPGEGTSPSGGEGEMPSPPPPVPPPTTPDSGTLPDDKKPRSRKNKKKLKREKPPKPKKKVKVKIITLKKPPRIPPLSSVLEDSDEMDDRSPPPPPPGSPPPPHLWPDYLQTYNTSTIRAMDATPATLSSSSVTLPPPTPLPLLVPPPPLNYSIQPSNKT